MLPLFHSFPCAPFCNFDLDETEIVMLKLIGFLDLKHH